MSSDDAGGKEVRTRAIGVPRRFAVGTAMLIMTMYGVLFATLRTLGAQPRVCAVVALLFTGVGAAQMLLFRGRRPREASYVAGAVLCPLLYVGAIQAALVLEMRRVLIEGPPLGEVYAAMGGLAMAGIPIGYVAGCLTAGVFLVLDRIDRRWHGPRADDETAPGESLGRSEEHTSELQSPKELVCRLL